MSLLPTPGETFVDLETGERVVVISASDYRVRFCSEDLARAESVRVLGPTTFRRCYRKAEPDDLLAWREALLDDEVRE